MALLNQLYNPKVLSEVFLRNAPGNYIGRKIAPLYKSPVDRGIIDKVDVYSEVNRLKQLITAPGVAPNMLDIVVEKNLSYVCQKRATGIALPEELSLRRSPAAMSVVPSQSRYPTCPMSGS